MDDAADQSPSSGEESDDSRRNEHVDFERRRDSSDSSSEEEDEEVERLSNAITTLGVSRRGGMDHGAGEMEEVQRRRRPTPRPTTDFSASSSSSSSSSALASTSVGQSLRGSAGNITKMRTRGMERSSDHGFEFLDLNVEVPPLDGEEGEVVIVDDEACFVDGFDKAAIGEGSMIRHDETLS